MRTSALFVALCLLFASSHCWNKICRVNILDLIRADMEADDISKATANLTIAAKAASFTEIYDNFLNYNSDFADRVNQNTDSTAFAKAETSLGMPELEKFLKVTAIEDTRAVVQYYYIGNCCYFFNPCLSIKIGYHAVLTLPGEDVNEEALKQSFVAAWRPTIDAIIQAKNVY